MVSALARMTSGDPRRPADIVRYKRPTGEEASLDPAAYLALGLGLLALVLKARQVLLRFLAACIPGRLRAHCWRGTIVEGCSLGFGFCVTVVPVQREEHGERPAPSHELDSVRPRAALCTPALSRSTCCVLTHWKPSLFAVIAQDHRVRPVCQLSAALAANAVRGEERLPRMELGTDRRADNTCLYEEILYNFGRDTHTPSQPALTLQEARTHTSWRTTVGTKPQACARNWLQTQLPPPVHKCWVLPTARE